MTQMDLTDFYGLFHPNRPHGIFSKIDHILSNKTNLNRYKQIGITPYILSDHNGLKLEFNSNTNSRKPTKTWKLNNAHLDLQ